MNATKLVDPVVLARRCPRITHHWKHCLLIAAATWLASVAAAQESQTGLRGTETTVTGVVTFYEPAWHTLYISTENGPVFVSVNDASKLQLALGDQVTVHGDWEEAGKHVIASAVDSHGMRPLPTAEKFDARPPTDGTRVTVRGWVYRDAGRRGAYRYFRLATPHSSLKIALRLDDSTRQISDWQAHEVELTGVYCQKQPPELFATTARLRVENETDGPKAPLRGIVASVAEDHLLVSHASTGIHQVELNAPSELQPGDFVEIRGAQQPTSTSGLPQLDQAEVLFLGKASPLSPAAIPLDEAARHIGKLSQFVGTLQSFDEHESAVRLTLTSGGESLHISGRTPSTPTDLTPGQVVRVTGVIEPQDDVSWFVMPMLTIEPVTAAPQSLLPLIGAMTGILAGGGLLAFIWVRRARDQRNFRRVVNERLAEISHVGRLDLLADMVGALAHQLNQPLTSVCSFARAAQLIHQKDPESDELHTCLDQIYDEGMRAGNIIQRIRALSRPRTDRRINVNLNHVISDVVEIFQLQAATSSELIHLDLANQLKHVSIDEVQIQQVLLNLLNNARDATSDLEDQPPRIEVESRMLSSGEVHVAVRDNGTGIPANEPLRMFGRYFTTKPDGSGLGLSISKAIIESHHGSIGAKRVSPRGTCVYFTLPTAPADELAYLTDSRHPDVPQRITSGSGAQAGQK